MTWLVILDNGEYYSDHLHMPVLACASEAEAIAAKAIWDAWFASAPRAKPLPDYHCEWVDRDWVQANPPPFGPAYGEHDFFYEDIDYHLGIIEVPEWAKT